MKVGLEIYISIALMTIMAVLCASFITADIKAADARDAYYSYYEQIENSNCAMSVMDACESGYDMEIIQIGNETNPMRKIVFKYKYNVSLLGVSKTHTIVGYVQE